MQSSSRFFFIYFFAIQIFIWFNFIIFGVLLKVAVRLEGHGFIYLTAITSFLVFLYYIVWSKFVREKIIMLRLSYKKNTSQRQRKIDVIFALVLYFLAMLCVVFLIEQ